MLDIIIVEDNKEHLEMIALFVRDILRLNNYEGQVLLKADKPEIVECFLKNNTANVFFIDIDLMAETNGLELAFKIKSQNKNAYLVFITNYIEFSIQAFKVHSFDYLPKPICKNSLSKCLKDIYDDILYKNFVKSQDTDNLLVIKSGYKNFFINKKEILFIEKHANKALVNTTNGQYICYTPLNEFEKLLCKDNNFIRCHKSFIVNTEYISEIRFNKLEIELVTGKICYISRGMKKNLCK